MMRSASAGKCWPNKDLRDLRIASAVQSCSKLVLHIRTSSLSSMTWLCVNINDDRVLAENPRKVSPTLNSNCCFHSCWDLIVIAGRWGLRHEIVSQRFNPVFNPMSSHVSTVWVKHRVKHGLNTWLNTGLNPKVKHGVKPTVKHRIKPTG